MSEYSKENTPVSHSHLVIIVLSVCFTVLCIALMIFLYALASLRQIENNSMVADEYPTGQATEVLKADIEETVAEIVPAPDYLSSDYEEAFQSRYSEETLRKLFEENKSETDPISDNYIYTRVIERTYSKFFQNGYKSGWMDYHSQNIDTSVIVAKFDVLVDETKEIAFADGYASAITYLSSKE